MIAAIVAAVSLQSALDRRVAGVPGTAIVVGIVDRGTTRTLLAGSTGNGRPLDRHTLFEIGSVSKTFTATVLAQMALAKRVRLSDPIAQFLPAGTNAPVKDGKAITLLDLAEQRSGLPRLPTNLQDVAGDDPYTNYTIADMYAFLNGYSLPRDPGASYEYSNYGVGLLGQLLANRAGTTYADLVRGSVLQPLGMDETTFALAGVADPALLAVGHDLSGAPVTTWHMQSIVPAGGIVSSLGDMLKYLRCNMGAGPLARACLFAQQPRAQGEARHEIGLIWNVSTTSGVVSHGGDTNGFHAYVAVSADRKRGVVAMSNGPIVADIAAHVLTPSYPIAACRSSVAAPQTDPASYTGVYCNASGGLEFTVASVPHANGLSIALAPQPAAVVEQMGPDTYYSVTAQATFKFVRDDGKIVGLWLLQNGQSIAAVRIDAHGGDVVAQLASPFPAAVELDRVVLAQYAGSYAADIGTFDVALRGGALYVRLSGQSAIPVYASAKDRFFYKVVDAQIDFNRDAAGNVVSLTLHQNGQTITATRQP